MKEMKNGGSMEKVCRKKNNTQVWLKYKLWLTDWVQLSWGYYKLCTWFEGMHSFHFSSSSFFAHFEIFQWKTLHFFSELFLNIFFCRVAQYRFHSTSKWLIAIMGQIHESKMPFGLSLQVKFNFIIQVDDESTETHNIHSTGSSRDSIHILISSSETESKRETFNDTPFCGNKQNKRDVYNSFVQRLFCELSHKWQKAHCSLNWIHSWSHWYHSYHIKLSLSAEHKADTLVLFEIFIHRKW